MRQNVQAVARILKAAGVDTEISDYPIAPLRAAAAQGVFVAHISAIAGLFLKSVDPSKYQQMFAVWMIGNFFRQFLVQTGAFEIWYGDVLVWSTLAERRLPEISDLVDRFARLGLHLPVRR